MSGHGQEDRGPKLSISASYEDYCDQDSLGILSNTKLSKMPDDKRKALSDLNTNARLASNGSQIAKRKWITSYPPEV